MAEDTQTPAKLVELIVLSLVDDPSAVEVIVRDEGHSSIIEVKVAPDDAGKVIGRQGRVVRALRTLARAASSYENGPHIEVEILD
ncbi:MAG: KH domain-containing protein [Coriobacteriia bacterium]|nr:KH domain-containing protein [Coriobacteriia bacterium]